MQGGQSMVAGEGAAPFSTYANARVLAKTFVRSY
jgi:hypothetical protein